MNINPFINRVKFKVRLFLFLSPSLKLLLAHSVSRETPESLEMNLTATLLDLILQISFFCLLIIFYYDHKFNYWKRRGVPFLKPQIPYGNFKSEAAKKVKNLAYVVKVRNLIKPQFRSQISARTKIHRCSSRVCISS